MSSSLLEGKNSLKLEAIIILLLSLMLKIRSCTIKTLYLPKEIEITALHKIFQLQQNFQNYALPL